MLNSSIQSLSLGQNLSQQEPFLVPLDGMANKIPIQLNPLLQPTMSPIANSSNPLILLTMPQGVVPQEAQTLANNTGIAPSIWPNQLSTSVFQNATKYFADCSSRDNSTPPPLPILNQPATVSGLPPGWKVVGLTSIDNAKTHSSLPLFPSKAETLQTPTSVKSSPISSSTISIDLNLPMAMPFVSNTAVLSTRESDDMQTQKKLKLNENTSIVRQSSIPSNSTQTVGVPSTKSGAKQPENNHITTLDFRNTNKDAVNSGIQEASKIGLDKPNLSSIKANPVLPLISHQNIGNVCTNLKADQSQWTIVGVTSLPMTPVTYSSTLFGDASTSVTKRNLISGSTESSSTIMSKGTILNVPLRKGSHSQLTKGMAPSSLPSYELETVLPRRTIDGTVNDSPLQDINRTDQKAIDMNNKWTIVGVTEIPPSSTIATQEGLQSQSRLQQSVINNNQMPQGLNLMTLNSLGSNMSSNKEGDIKYSPSKTLGSNLLSMTSSSLGEEWKVVGITQIPVSEPSAKPPVNNPSIPLAVSLTNSQTVFNTGVSPGGIMTSGLLPQASHLPHLSSNLNLSPKSNIVLENISNPFIKPAMSFSELNTQPNQLTNILNLQLELQKLQQQQEQQQAGAIKEKQSFTSQDIDLNLISNSSADLISPLQKGGLLSNNLLLQLQNIQSDKMCPIAANTSLIHSPPSILKARISTAAIPQEPRLSLDDLHLPVTSRPSVPEANRDQCTDEFQCMNGDAKNMCIRCMKKHTVSKLLRMKRMKDKNKSNYKSSSKINCHLESDNESESHKIVKHFTDGTKLLKHLPSSRPIGNGDSNSKKSERDERSRPLHSYSGNRDLFSKSPPIRNSNNKSSPMLSDRISLRSGTQVPVCHSDNVGKHQNRASNVSKDSEHGINANVNSVDIESKKQDRHESFMKTDGSSSRSSARKRKLNVPRKMIADLDYHPYDSSSDSN